MKFRHVLAVASLFLAACAFTPHEVDVTAEAPKTPSTVGNGISVFLQVIDDRESQVVGQRGAGLVGADITAKQVVPVIEQELTLGLQAKGFTVLTKDQPNVIEIEARLRAFKFFIETGLFSGEENTDVAIALEAEDGRDDYDQVYRSNDEEGVFFVPGGDAIDAKLNAGLTQVLTLIMTDQDLIDFLVRKRPAQTSAVPADQIPNFGS